MVKDAEQVFTCLLAGCKFLGHESWVQIWGAVHVGGIAYYASGMVFSL